MLRCLSLLVAVLLLTTGSPLSHAVSNWTQVMEASVQQSSSPGQDSMALFGSVSAGLAIVVLAAWISQARRHRRMRFHRPPTNLLWTPRRK